MSIGENAVGTQQPLSSDGDLRSRFEIVRDDLIAEFNQISIDNGYRNNVAKVIPTIRPISHITQFPEIGVQLADRVVEMESSNWQSSFAKCTVWVQANVESGADIGLYPADLTNKCESISHDLLRVMSNIFTKYINSSAVGVNATWNVLVEPIDVMPPFFFGEKPTKAFVMMKFRIQVRALGGSFA